MRIAGVPITKRRLMVTGGLMFVSALSGGGAGYFVAMKKLETKYSKISEIEIEEAKEFYENKYKRIYKADEFESINDVAENLLTREAFETTDALAKEAESARTNYAAAFDATPKPDREDKDRSDPRPTPETVVNVHNVFVNPPEDPLEDENEFDYEAELRNRSEDYPFIITQEEWLENEPEHDQVTVTFYEEDGMLADEQDKPVPDSDEIVGDVNLNRFGYGSKNNNIVYIRNMKMGVDYEVTRSFGSYAQEVLGFTHSDDIRPRIRKFRGEDE